MNFEIRHRIEYRYSVPVFLEPHLLHLVPREDGSQILRRFELRVDPEPLLVSRILDAAGNPAHELWFRGPTDRFIIETSAAVEVTRSNPFDYLLREEAMRLPVRYAEPLLPLLAAFCTTAPLDPEVKAFAEAAVEKSGRETVGFLSELCLMIHRRVRYGRREEGAPYAAEKTLAESRGSCRDLTVLFMACAASQGLAVRFTSGYADIAAEVNGELHAWPEVYLEGAGWRGYDPSTGLAVADSHVALASAPDPQLVTPVAGTLRGAATATLQTCVSIRPIPAQIIPAH